MAVHDAPTGSKPGEWKFLMAQTWRQSDPEYDAKALQGRAILDDMKQRAKEFGPNFSEIWQSMPDDTPCWHSRVADWAPDMRWDNHNGTVTLVGDAAHSLTFRKSFEV